MKFKIILCLALVLSGILCSDLIHAEEHLWLQGKVNNKPARFIFDSGSSDTSLFPKGAKRLGLKYQIPADPGVPPTPRSVPAGITEECEFTLISQTWKMQFYVVALEDDDLTEADGVLGWGSFIKNIFFIDAGRSNVFLLADVPEKAKRWQPFHLRADTRVVIIEVPENGITNLVLLDTGAEGGLYLTPEKWRDWKAAHPTQRLTFGINYIPAAGVFLNERSWADQVSVGPLLFKDVPISEAHPVQIHSPSSVASIGLRAMRQLQIIIDGKQGMAYVHTLNRKPEPYQHNRLGAVFIPDDPDNDDLVAHVANESPAQRAGIQNGDVLLKIGDFDATKWRADAFSFVSKSWEKPKGTELHFTLKRGKQTNDMTVKLETILGPDTP